MRESQFSPIGVFDSGVGGLTVLRELYRQLPRESILYFGDTARLPYGTRTKTEIIGFVRDILHWMTDQPVKMVIMACNTSSALALDEVRAEFPGLPILGVILPGAQTAVRKGKRIGIIATPATVASNAYERAIQEIEPSAAVWQVACPEFVPLIEANRIFDPHTRRVAKEYLKPLIDRNIDTLVYGCTHYRHLAPVLQELLPSSVELVDPARSVVRAAEKELELLGLKNSDRPLPTRFAVSGDPDAFTRLSRQWLGYSPTVGKVHFPAPVMMSLSAEVSVSS
jgi:glutamate racemase